MAMLTSLLALLTSGFRQDETITPMETMGQVADLVRSVGYEYVPKPGAIQYGDLYRGASHVIMLTNLQPAQPDQGLPARVGSVSLWLEIQTPDQVPLLRSGTQEPFNKSGELSFVPHLGHTVEITMPIDLREGLTRTRLRADLDRFWKLGEKFAKAQRAAFGVAPTRDWSKARFDDGMVIDRVDEVSLDRLVQSWGWTFRPRHGWGHSGGGWVVFATIDDRDILFSQRADLDGPNDGFKIIGEYELPHSIDVKSWVETHEKALAPMEAFASPPYSVGLRSNIDLRKGMRLGELRRRIKAFADDLLNRERRGG